MAPARASSALLVALLLLPAFSGAQAPRGQTASLLDLDADGVDDALADARGIVPVLVSFRHMPGAAERASLAAVGARVLAGYDHFPVLVAQVPAEALRAVAAVPGARLVELDAPVRRLLKESVPLMGVPEARETHEVSGAGIVVAVLDDGIYAEHPDLASRFVARHDATAAVATPADVDPLGRAFDSLASAGHGTHVTGTILGPGTRSGGVYEGVAPGARFVDVKVFVNEDDTSASVVMRGLDWVVSQREALDIRVVSMSVGGRATDGSDALARAADAAVAAGLVVVIAAGNDGPDEGTVGTPGTAFDVVTVGAVDKRKRVADFSARGPTPDGRLKPDLVAPGMTVTSTVPPASQGGVVGLLTSPTDASSGFYAPLMGTSIATPHVAGVVALMLEANPALTPAEVKRILQGSAQDLGAPGPDAQTGYGFVNAIAALQVAADPALLALPRFSSSQDGESIETAGADAGSIPLSAILLVAAGAAATVAAVGVAIAMRRRA